jgi:hypothetical protein
VITALSLTGWRPGAAWAAVALALGLQSITDAAYAREIALGTYEPGELIAPLWPVAYLLLAFAASRPLRPSGISSPALPSGCRRWWRSSAAPAATSTRAWWRRSRPS